MKSLQFPAPLRKSPAVGRGVCIGRPAGVARHGLQGGIRRSLRGTQLDGARIVAAEVKGVARGERRHQEAAQLAHLIVALSFSLLLKEPLYHIYAYIFIIYTCISYYILYIYIIYTYISYIYICIIYVYISYRTEPLRYRAGGQRVGVVRVVRVQGVQTALVEALVPQEPLLFTTCRHDRYCTHICI